MMNSIITATGFAVLLALSLVDEVTSCESSNFRSDDIWWYTRSNCELSRVPRDIPRNVDNINLNSNQIRTLQTGTFRHHSRCEWLLLFDNSISEIQAGSFTGLRNLEFLMLSGNKLEKVLPSMWKGLNKLLNLDLSHNQLEILPPAGFRNLQELITLDLTGNSLKDVTPDDFDGLENLTNLYLARNRLTSLLPGTFAFLPQMEFLSLDGNPLHCDVHMCWLKDLQNEGGVSFWFGGLPQCINYPDVDWHDVELKC